MVVWGVMRYVKRNLERRSCSESPLVALSPRLTVCTALSAKPLLEGC